MILNTTNCKQSNPHIKRWCRALKVDKGDKWSTVGGVFEGHVRLSFRLIFRGRNFHGTELAESRLWRKHEAIIKSLRLASQKWLVAALSDREVSFFQGQTDRPLFLSHSDAYTAQNRHKQGIDSAPDRHFNKGISNNQRVFPKPEPSPRAYSTPGSVTNVEEWEVWPQGPRLQGEDAGKAGAREGARQQNNRTTGHQQDIGIS
jgi:hypothetical protein